MIIQCMRMQPYFIGDYIYPMRIYLQKNWKFHNPNDINKNRYDSNMNSRKVIIEIVFRSLKNHKIILKFFNSNVNRCRNPSLGLTTKVKAYKVEGQERSLGVAFHVPGSVGKCEGINLHIPKRIPKWISNLGVRVPMDSRIFRKRLQGSKLIGLKNYLYHWKYLGT